MDQKNQEKNTNTDITLFGLFATAVTLIASLVYQYSKDVLTTEFQIHMNETICKSQNITVTQEYNKVVPTFLSEYVFIAVFSLFMMISFMWAYVYSNEDKIKINRNFFKDTAGEFLDSFIILSISVVIGLSQVSKNNISNIMGTITTITIGVIIWFVIFIMLIYWAMGKFSQISSNRRVIIRLVIELFFIFLLLLFIFRYRSLFYIVCIIAIVIVIYDILREQNIKLSLIVFSLISLCIANEIIVNDPRNQPKFISLNLSALYILIFIVKFVIDNKILLNSDNSSNNSARGSKPNNNNQRKPDNGQRKPDNCKPDNGWTCFEICIRPKDP